MSNLSFIAISHFASKNPRLLMNYYSSLLIFYSFSFTHLPLFKLQTSICPIYFCIKFYVNGILSPAKKETNCYSDSWDNDTRGQFILDRTLICAIEAELRVLVESMADVNTRGHATAPSSFDSPLCPSSCKIYRCKSSPDFSV